MEIPTCKNEGQSTRARALPPGQPLNSGFPSSGTPSAGLARPLSASVGLSASRGSLSGARGSMGLGACAALLALLARYLVSSKYVSEW